MKTLLLTLLLLFVSCKEYHDARDCSVDSCTTINLWTRSSDWGGRRLEYRATLSCGTTYILGNDTHGVPADPFNGYVIGDAWYTSNGPQK